jgi:hypothetical protein
VREGHCRRASTTDCGPAGRFTNPIHDYRHRDDCRSITGGAFVPAGVWPGWDGSYLYGDFACGRIFRLVPRADGGFGRSTFMSGADGPVHLRFGPHPDSGDRIIRWAWDFGDGTSAATTTPRTSHTYAAEGPMQVGLTVTDSRGQSSTTTFKTVHAGEHPPTVSITRPGPDARFAVGQTVDLTFRTSPAGGRLLILGELRRTPVSLESWVRYVIPVRAPDQRIGGVPHVFRSWSDGKNRLHDIVSPAVPTEYVARFRRR